MTRRALHLQHPIKFTGVRVAEKYVEELMEMLEITKKRDALPGNKVLVLLVNGIRRYHLTMVMVTHDMDIAKQANVIVKTDEVE